VLMLTLLLFCNYGQQQLQLKNGQSVAFDSYKRCGQVVLLRHGGKIISLDNSDVDWSKAPDLDSRPQIPTWKTVAADTETELGDDILIQRLDVKKTSLIDLIRFMADMGNFNLYIDSSVKDEDVTFLLKNIPLRRALKIILANSGLDAQMKYDHVSVRPY